MGLAQLRAQGKKAGGLPAALPANRGEVVVIENNGVGPSSLAVVVVRLTFVVFDRLMQEKLPPRDRAWKPISFFDADTFSYSLGAAPPSHPSFSLAVALVTSAVAIGWCGGPHGERCRS